MHPYRVVLHAQGRSLAGWKHQSLLSHGGFMRCAAGGGSSTCTQVLCRRLPGQTQANATSSRNQPPASAPPYLCRVFGALRCLLLRKFGVQPVLLGFEACQVARILLLGPALLLGLHRRRPQCCRAFLCSYIYTVWRGHTARSCDTLCLDRLAAWERWRSTRLNVENLCACIAPQDPQNAFWASKMLDAGPVMSAFLPQPAAALIGSAHVGKHQTSLSSRPLLDPLPPSASCCPAWHCREGSLRKPCTVKEQAPFDWPLL